jgi:hypothetical protein
MPLTPRPPSRRTPHNKSERARAAELNGERTWTNWRLRDLVDQVLRINTRDVEARDLRSVGNLEFLKVKLLVPTAKHHTGLRMPEPVTLKQDQYYGLNVRAAERLNAAQIARWRSHPPTDEELDEAVENLTGKRYYREPKG